MAEILVLEDDEDTRELNQSMLEAKTGAEADTAGSVDEEDLNEYSVVVSDYNGIEVEELYAEAENLVIFTGFPEEDIDIPEHAEHLMKGTDYDKLAETVSEYLT